MILFITSQDDATNSNFLVAGHLATMAATALCGEAAVRANAIPALTTAPTVPLLAFSHGEVASIRGHDDQAALQINDLPVLSERTTFAFACHTAGLLGPSVATAGGTWFGFAGPINCLPADANHLHHFRSIVDFVNQRFPTCGSTTAAKAFIDDLDMLTETVYEAISADGTFEQFHALRDITRRLRIWLPNATQAVKHPEAHSDPLV